MRLRDPGQPVSVNNREPDELARFRGEPLQHRLRRIDDPRRREVEEGQRQELGGQKVEPALPVLSDIAMLCKSGEQTVRRAPRNAEPFGDPQ